MPSIAPMKSREFARASEPYRPRNPSLRQRLRLWASCSCIAPSPCAHWRKCNWRKLTDECPTQCSNPDFLNHDHFNQGTPARHRCCAHRLCGALRGVVLDLKGIMGWISDRRMQRGVSLYDLGPQRKWPLRKIVEFTTFDRDFFGSSTGWLECGHFCNRIYGEKRAICAKCKEGRPKDVKGPRGFPENE